MESKKNTGLVVMMLMVMLIATFTISAATEMEKTMIELVTNYEADAFPRKVLNSGGSQACSAPDKPCSTHEDCPPSCACYSRYKTCGDWV